MNADSRLSIAIPSYNRADYLRVCIQKLLDATGTEDIDIYVSDNASEDHTREVLKDLSRDHPVLSYSTSDVLVPPDRNFERALSLPDTDYVWLFGDTYTIPDETVRIVKQVIENSNYDLIVVNSSGRVVNVDEKVYTDRSELLADLGWHMTCMSTLIYSRKLLESADFARYRDTNFLQTGIIFEYLADKPFKVKWIPQHSVSGLEVPGVKKTSWESQTFEIWTKRWANFVFSLPAAYSLEAKLKCAMAHGVKSGVFDLSALKRLRIRNLLNREVYQAYSKYFPFTINYPLPLIKVISVAPSWLLRLL